MVNKNGNNEYVKIKKFDEITDILVAENVLPLYQMNECLVFNLYRLGHAYSYHKLTQCAGYGCRCRNVLESNKSSTTCSRLPGLTAGQLPKTSRVSDPEICDTVTSRLNK